jgi:predicted branched-subunit amino acid permease
MGSASAGASIELAPMVARAAPLRRRRAVGSGEGFTPKRGYWDGARAVSPLAVAIAAFGISFGVLARSAGLSPWAAVVMSATTLAGSAQFAAVSVLAAGGGALVAVVAGALLNARYAVMGLSAAPALAGPVWSRLLLAQLVVDESWAVAHRSDGSVDRERLIGAGLMLFASHVASTAVGAFGVGMLTDPAALGLDAAFPAMFLALLWPHLGQPGARWVAAFGAMVALALTPLGLPGVPILAAAAVAAAAAWVRRS